MDTSESKRRIQLLIWGVIGTVALAAAILIGTAGSEGSGFRFLGFGSDEPAAVTPATGEGSAPRQIDLPSADGVTPAPQDSVPEFTAEHGNPPNTDFARLRIPSIGVDAPVGRWLVDGTIMPEPYGPVDVAFYDLTDWPGLGGFPGEGQNAIFGAHVDLNRYVSYADANYRGPAVFWALDQLTPGTLVEVDYAGETLRYAVTWTEEVDAVGSDWGAYFTADVPVDSITLYTCGGEFDFSSASYSHRVVVRAERVP